MLDDFEANHRKLDMLDTIGSDRWHSHSHRFEPPARPASFRRGMYWGARKSNWAGLRFARKNFEREMGLHRRTRERLAFATTLPARRAGRMRVKQADVGAARRARDAALVASHLAFENYEHLFEYMDDSSYCDWPCECTACCPYTWDCYSGHAPPLRVSFVEAVRTGR